MHSRDQDFDFTDVNTLYWNGSDTVGTLLNALSTMFPVGEKHFIQAVRHYEASVPEIAEDIRVFYKQEARHSREHNKFNKQMAAEGLNLVKIEDSIKSKLARFNHDPEAALISTVVLEEITGLGAVILPKIHEYVLRGDQRVAALWLWHAIEEQEHVHVARHILKKSGISKFKVVKFAFITVKLFVQQVMENIREVNKAKELCSL